MKNKVLILILIISMFSLTACWDRRPVDELGIISNMTIDQANESLSKLQVSIIRPTFEKDKKKLAHKAIVEAESIVNALKKLQKGDNKVYQLGGTRSVLLSKKIAQSGINKILSEFDHISDFETQAHFVVFDGTIEELFTFDPPRQERTSMFILGTIESSIKKQQIAETKFHDVMSIYSLVGQEMVLPLVKISQGNLLVDGFAVFKGDKLAGIINIVEGAPFIIIILPNINELLINIPSEETADCAIDNLSVVIRKKKVKIKAQIEQNIPVIDVEVILTVDLEAFTSRHFEDVANYETLLKEKVKEIENSVASYLQKLTCSLIEKTQKEFESDIFGFGEKVRVQENEYFKNVNWREVYPEADITCNFKVSLRKMGTVK